MWEYIVQGGVLATLAWFARSYFMTLEGDISKLQNKEDGHDRRQEEVLLICRENAQSIRSLSFKLDDVSSSLEETKRLYIDTLVKYHNLRADVKRHEEILQNIKKQ